MKMFTVDQPIIDSIIQRVFDVYNNTRDLDFLWTNNGWDPKKGGWEVHFTSKKLHVSLPLTVYEHYFTEDPVEVWDRELRNHGIDVSKYKDQNDRMFLRLGCIVGQFTAHKLRGLKENMNESISEEEKAKRMEDVEKAINLLSFYNSANIAIDHISEAFEDIWLHFVVGSNTETENDNVVFYEKDGWWDPSPDRLIDKKIYVRKGEEYLMPDINIPPVLYNDVHAMAVCRLCTYLMIYLQKMYVENPYKKKIKAFRV